MTKTISRGAIIAFVVLFSLACNRKTDQGKASEKKVSEEKVVLKNDFIVDLDLSKVLWSGESLGMYKHEGTVNLSEANIIIQDGKISGGNFTADLTTITATDENFNPAEGYTKEKLKGHLMSADFFDVENYPEASFILNQLNETVADGTLTIRGHSHAEQVKNIAISRDGENVKITGEMVFNRKKYDVSWDYSMKDRILSEDIKLKIILVGK